MLTSLYASKTASPETLPSPKVMIGLLGPFRITVDDQLLPIQGESKSALLVCHLALAQGRRIPKSILLERLWPQKSPQKAAPCLNSLTYALNKTIKQTASIDGLVHFRGGAYHLDINEQVAVDIDFFNAWFQEGMRHIANERASRGLALFEQAISLYRGDLCFVDTLEALIERERLRILLLNALAFLANHHYQEGRYLQAQLYAFRLLSNDPFREDMHRLIMRCFAVMGQRTQALHQYQVCRQLLAREFDLEPEAATQRLYDQIRNGEGELDAGLHQG